MDESMEEVKDVYLNGVKVDPSELEELAKKSSVRLHEESPGHYRKLERIQE
jgi:hypothetical protein